MTYAGTPSAAASILVVPTALGLDTYYGSGTGLGVATSPTTGALYNYTNSISPGSTIVLWGSGLGADTADSDTVFTSTPHPVSSPLTIYIGGVQANVLYAGSAGYPGVNQINVTVPSSVPTGCGVSVVAVSGSIVSNTVTLPFGSGVCSDPVLGYNGTQLTNSGSQSGTYTVGEVTLDQSTTPAVGSTGGQTTGASAIFEKITYNAATTSSGITSLGSCAVSTSSTTISIGTIPTIVGLDAGNITVTGPTGTQPLATEAIPTQTGPSGLYFSQLANSFLPATGGSFTFTGSGGKDVGAFTATISIGNVLNWTNQSSLSSVTRTNGVTLNWTGGSSNSYVYIQGTSSSNSASASFLCYAPASAGQFTVPSYVLLALPPSTNGTLGIANGATPTSFTASGLTNPGIGIIAVSYGITASYN